jgi:hypothetical protein
VSGYNRSVHRLQVESSAIGSVGYDPLMRVLEVEFVGGGVYRYLGVPPREHETLMRAESLGTYVNKRIKPYYRFVRVAT